MRDEAKQEFRRSFMEKYGGLSKSGGVIFLENGSTYTKVAMPNNEAQFLETRRFQKEEIASIYRMPLHLIQDLQQSTNNNIEHQSLEFVMYTMLPWFTRWEQFINFKLLPKQERQQGYFAEFLINALLRGDTVARAQMLHLMRNDGVINADEWRELENMNPQEKDQGKYYFINGNMRTTEFADIPADDPPDAPFTVPYLQQGADGVLGGIQLVWTGEAKTVSDVKDPVFKDLTLTPNEVSGMATINNKTLNNWGASGAFVENLLRQAWIMGRDAKSLKGSGAGCPLGILKSPGIIEIARDTAATVKYIDVINMLSRLIPEALNGCHVYC